MSLALLAMGFVFFIDQKNKTNATNLITNVKAQGFSFESISCDGFWTLSCKLVDFKNSVFFAKEIVIKDMASVVSYYESKDTPFSFNLMLKDPRLFLPKDTKLQIDSDVLSLLHSLKAKVHIAGSGNYVLAKKMMVDKLEIYNDFFTLSIKANLSNTNEITIATLESFSAVLTITDLEKLKQATREILSAQKIDPTPENIKAFVVSKTLPFLIVLNNLELDVNKITSAIEKQSLKYTLKIAPTSKNVPPLSEFIHTNTLGDLKFLDCYNIDIK